VDIDGRVLHVKRLKPGLSTTHPLALTNFSNTL
jgi:hypothetical protein